MFKLYINVQNQITKQLSAIYIFLMNLYLARFPFVSRIYKCSYSDKSFMIKNSDKFPFMRDMQNVFLQKIFSIFLLENN